MHDHMKRYVQARLSTIERFVPDLGPLSRVKRPEDVRDIYFRFFNPLFMRDGDTDSVAIPYVIRNQELNPDTHKMKVETEVADYFFELEKGYQERIFTDRDMKRAKDFGILENFAVGDILVVLNGVLVDCGRAKEFEKFRRVSQLAYPLI